MAQARVLSDVDLKRVLAVVALTRHAGRNRLVVMLSCLAGLRAGEVAALKIGDVLAEDGKIMDRIYLSNEQTKGKRGRTVFVNTKLRREVERYLVTRTRRKRERALIESQKQRHFSATTMVMLFRRLYDAAGLRDARSHSGRRSYITKLANKGVSVRLIQVLVGHRSMQTTQGYILADPGCHRIRKRPRSVGMRPFSCSPAAVKFRP